MVGGRQCLTLTLLRPVIFNMFPPPCYALHRAIVLVGDPAQLPATIFSNTAKDANYGQSLFQRLQRGGHPKLMLDTQYRMHPSIASFPSARFYNGLLRLVRDGQNFTLFLDLCVPHYYTPRKSILLSLLILLCLSSSSR